MINGALAPFTALGGRLSSFHRKSPNLILYIMEELEKENELIFKRFPEGKQEQIRQLVSYTTLMGLTGKDLVSIGGKLIRLDEKHERENNLRIAEGYAATVKPAGKTKKDQDQNENRKWIYVDATNNRWEFQTSSFYKCDVINRSTNNRKHFFLEIRINKYLKGKGYMYNALLNLHHGNIQLNF
jgi:hypothetical protein